MKLLADRHVPAPTQAGAGPGRSSTPFRRLLRSGQRIGVRARSVLVAVVVVFAALLVGGAGLLYTLENDLEQTATANARARASEVVAQLTTDGLAATEEAVSQQTRGNSVVQILDADGTVLAASSNDLSREPMSSQRPDVGAYAAAEVDLDHIQHGVGGEWTVVSTATRLDDTTYVVQSAVPIGIQRDTIQTVAVFLLGGTPLLLGAVALAVWMLVGRALRSVESIRATVAEIDSHRLTERVAVPPTRDEIAALALTMNTMLDRLQVSDAAQRAFVSDASHELRSPLATLTSAGELAVGATPERQSALLETMNLEIARLRGLVENLMTLARADTQELAAQRSEVDLDDLLAEELRRLRLTGGLQVVVEMVSARVLGDQQSLGQALRNVVDNAARHARTTVRLILTVTATDAIVWVDNDGPVIPVEDRERVFERFVRLDEARTRDAGGSGLGLAISRAALRAHGGDALVVDGPDGWCRFQLRLPRVTET
ncbi:ATP-binding protein [Microlunatus aurantiacus]|uniref:histidine kinase n=1 Tax=Microlunatus aurantiacus TaxID=446786 RepID=A0ABP7CJH3_9ACTN